jgi:hypothetical protein
MYTARAVKPKLSVSIAAATGGASRPALSLKSPMAMTMPRTPLSPSPLSPTARNTRLNQQGYSTLQQPTFSYTNTSSSKSILKKSYPSGTRSGKSIQFNGEPTVHCITPIQDPDYYGGYAKMSKEERRWVSRP